MNSRGREVIIPNNPSLSLIRFWNNPSCALCPLEYLESHGIQYKHLLKCIKIAYTKRRVTNISYNEHIIFLLSCIRLQPQYRTRTGELFILFCDRVFVSFIIHRLVCIQKHKTFISDFRIVIITSCKTKND